MTSVLNMQPDAILIVNTDQIGNEDPSIDSIDIKFSNRSVEDLFKINPSRSDEENKGGLQWLKSYQFLPLDMKSEQSNEQLNTETIWQAEANRVWVNELNTQRESQMTASALLTLGQLIRKETQPDTDTPEAYIMLKPQNDFVYTDPD